MLRETTGYPKSCKWTNNQTVPSLDLGRSFSMPSLREFEQLLHRNRIWCPWMAHPLVSGVSVSSPSLLLIVTWASKVGLVEKFNITVHSKMNSQFGVIHYATTPLLLCAWRFLHTKIAKTGWENSLVCKVLAAQAWGPQFDPNAHEKLEHRECAYNPSTGEADRRATDAYFTG